MAKMQCPYYTSSGTLAITCSAVLVDTKITSQFQKKEKSKLTGHKRAACRDDWRSCPIALILKDVDGGYGLDV